jgi:hypothetical protein
MTKLRGKIHGGMSVVALVGVVAGTGLTAASASQVGASVRSGFEHFQIMTTSSTTSRQSIIATGMFTAGGVDHSGARVDTAVFPDGTFKIAHSSGIGTPRFNPKTIHSSPARVGSRRSLLWSAWWSVITALRIRQAASAYAATPLARTGMTWPA